MMNTLRNGIDCFIPDSESLPKALSRCTHLCLAAHQDDIEILAYSGIAYCYEKKEKDSDCFVGVVLTDGSGSIREAQHQKLSAKDYSEVRREEQRKAAAIGRYGAVLQLGFSSAEVKGHSETLISDLITILHLTQPHTLYLHSPADRHETHVAIFLHCLEALRQLPPDKVPKEVYGCEVWGSLDWLPRSRRIALDSSAFPDVASQLLTVFSSQIEGGKEYGRGTIGRRQGNATFTDPYAPDPSSGITWAMDLLPLITNHELSVEDFLKNMVEEFFAEIRERIRKFNHTKEKR